MNATFYVSVAIAVLAITRSNAVHALLYLIVSLLAVALVLYTLGAPFVAALEVIIYAGVIMVLFFFVIMMLNLGAQAGEQEREWTRPATWLGPALLSLILVGEVVAVLAGAGGEAITARPIEPKQVGLGQEVEVRVDSFPGRVFGGEVASIAGEAEFTPRNVQTQEERVNLVFAVKVRIPNPGHLLKPGMPADATIGS